MSLAVPSRDTLQVEWSAGMVRAVAPHLIPRNGAWRLQNVLVGDDGPYRRGGTSYKSNAAFGTSGLRMIWDGWLAGGQRTVFANADDFGILDVDDLTPVNVGGPGLSGPVKPVALDGLLFAGVSAYGGSRKTAPYSAGTIALTADGKTVVGTGTSWSANVDAGMVLVIGNRLHAVASVTDNTHLELLREFRGSTASGLAYSLTPVAAIPSVYNPGGSWAVAGNRLVSMKGDRIATSAQFNSTEWDVTDEWLLPEGVQILGGTSLGDTLSVFTTAGMWTLSNLDYDLTDASGNTQQQLQRVNGDVVLWGDSGIATWENALVVPAIDGVWILRRESVDVLSRSITPLYTDYVARGYRVGQAEVVEGHYKLPILDFGGSPVDLLVCRLDRPVEVRGLGKVWPWTNFKGAGANVAALTLRVNATGARSPVLLGADRTAASRVIQYPPLKPDGPRVDHDGTAPVWEVITRDYPAGEMGTVKKARLRYELVAGVDVASIQGSFGTEARAATGVKWGQAKWGQFMWQASEALAWTPLTGAAPESQGDTPKRWMVAKRARFVRFRFRCTDGCERLVLRSLEVFVRPSGRL